MNFDVLLAKSCDEPENISSIPDYAFLYNHLRFVEDAGKAIFETVGERVLQQIGLNDKVWNSRLERALTVACLCHDIGKANDGFQKMVRKQISPKVQPLRHELLSALLLIEKGEIQTWALNLLNKNESFDDAEKLLECVIAAISGHHVKMACDWKKASIALRDEGCGDSTKTLLTHSDLEALFDGKTITEVEINLEKRLLEDRRIDFHKRSNRFSDHLEENLDWWRFTAILKALMMAADVAGSAVSEQANNLGRTTSPGEWVRANLAESQFLTKEQIHAVVKVRLEENNLYPFQKAVADSKANVTLVEAGCGTGKTVAAYAWAENHAIGKKLFFCYPTTGTATEGFLGYVAKSEVEAELIHSRSSVDFDKMARVEGDEEGKDDKVPDYQIRIDSLRAWFPQVVICTADAVLSLVRSNRRGLYNSPSILTASFVFDELHAYDNQMFNAVIALIQALPNAHFLLMTASLPKSRKEFLRKYVDFNEVPNPKEIEELPRYQFQRLTNQEEAYNIAEKTKKETLKILWICNTVAKAQEVFDELQKRKLPVQTYHSRFKYEHRKKRHDQVIKGFEPKNKKAMIAVTTQVAEMSLDLDADILISDVAPVSSLIQRLGRLNRRISLENPGTPRTAYFLSLDENKILPYEKLDIDFGESWLSDLIKLNCPLNQSDLSNYFQRLPAKDETNLNTNCHWLDSGWFAIPEEVREPNTSVSVILPEDEKICELNRKEIINKAIPMNYRKEMDSWKPFKGNLIAPPNMIDYNKERGARWQQK